MPTTLDLITGALRKIGEYAQGEVISAADQADCLDSLNGLLDLWSNEHLTVYNNVENILTLTPGKMSYTVGNPVGGTVAGTTSIGSNVVTGVTPLPGLIVGSSITAPGIPLGATVTTVGANSFTLSAPATLALTQLLTFTTPGDFPIARPLRLTNIYSRITTSGSAVDFGCQAISGDKYTAIGLKSQPGPWPKFAYYNTGFPYAELLLWPVPSQGCELHMWSDMLMADLALTDTLNLPQGYYMALQFNLAALLGIEYGVDPQTLATVSKAASNMKRVLKSTNATPQAEVPLDVSYISGNTNDAGWILTGGF